MSAVKVRPFDRASAAERDAFVRAHPRKTFFHLTGWGRTVESVFGHAVRDLVAEQDGCIVGVMPLTACRSLRGRTNLVSAPYAVYGGALGADPEVERALFDAAERMAVDAGVGRLELRCLYDPALELPSSTLYATFRRELPATVDEVLGSMPKKSRADARKARTALGLELREEPEGLALLVDLFHRNKRSLGSPGLPARWFGALRAEFPDSTTLHVVRREGEPLAAVMSFLVGDEIDAYYSGTSDEADREYKASSFMYMALQEWAVTRGYKLFDFGRSRCDSGAFDFKRRQGFEPQPLHYRYRLVRDRELPSLNPSNPKTARVRETWSKLPLWLTRKLSGPAMRLLP